VETRRPAILESLPIGKARLLREGHKLALLSFGCMLDRCLAIAGQLDASVADMRFIKPLDRDLILKLVETHDYLVTVEENALAGGAGSAVTELLAGNNIYTPVLNIGLPDRFIDHGARDDLLAYAGLSQDNILRTIQEWLALNVEQSKKTSQIS
jgi:1-deoxy-D-xylulose-5-phosphate synthase